MSTTVTYKNEEIASLTNATKTLETAGKYLEADIVLSDYTPQPTPLEPMVRVTSSLSQQTIDPAPMAGFQRVIVNPITSTLLANLDVDFTAANIKKNVDMFGVVGTYEGDPPSVQSKTATPSLSSQSITPDSGYDGLSFVTVNPITGTLLGNLDADFIADNIKKDVDLFGVVGTYEGSGGGGGGDGTTVTITMFDPFGVIQDVIYPSSATWSGWGTTDAGTPRGILTLPANSMFIVLALSGQLNTSGGATATKIAQSGSRINPDVWYVNTSSLDGSVTGSL